MAPNDDVGNPGIGDHHMSCVRAPALRDYGPFTLDVTYARAKVPGCSGKRSSGLKRLPNLSISDFGNAPPA